MSSNKFGRMAAVSVFKHEREREKEKEEEDDFDIDYLLQSPGCDKNCSNDEYSENNGNNHTVQNVEKGKKKKEKEFEELEEEEDFDIDYLLRSARGKDESNALKNLNNEKKEQAPMCVILNSFCSFLLFFSFVLFCFCGRMKY